MLKFGQLAHVPGLKDVNICVLEFCTSLDMILISGPGVIINYAIKFYAEHCREFWEKICWRKVLGYSSYINISEMLGYSILISLGGLKRYGLIQEFWKNKLNNSFRISICHAHHYELTSFLKRYEMRSLGLLCIVIWKLGVGACHKGTRQGLQRIVRMIITFCYPIHVQRYLDLHYLFMLCSYLDQGTIYDLITWFIWLHISNCWTLKQPIFSP